MMKRPLPNLSSFGIDRRTILGGLSALLVGRLSTAHAQQWPSSSIRIVVPYTPGGAADTLARLIQDGLSSRLGQPVLVENKPGGSGIPGTDSVIRSTDGHTIGLIVSVHASSVALKMPLPYDPIVDVTPLTLLGRVPLVLVVTPEVKATNVKELVEEVRRGDRKFFAATSGLGTAGHFAVELLNLESDIKIEPVHYKGAAPAAQDLLGGQVHMQFATLSSVWPHVEAGKLRALAVSTAQRSSLRPELATLSEQTDIANFDFAEWYGLIAPPNTPAEHAQKLHAALVDAVKDQAVQDKCKSLGIEVETTSMDGLREMIKSDIERLSRLVERANIKLE